MVWVFCPGVLRRLLSGSGGVMVTLSCAAPRVLGDGWGKAKGHYAAAMFVCVVVRLAQAAATRLSRGDCRVLQRGNGAHTLAAWCLDRGCNHFRVLDVSAYPDDVTVPSFGRRLWCGRWGHRGAEARPKWREMHKHADERLSAMHPIATEYIAAQRMTRSAKSDRCTAC